MLKHGGGGHSAAGTCQIPSDDADALLPEIVEALNQSIDIIAENSRIAALAR
jgi:nanoRNase/pAp phosphatase (c-di-AMP/oligoRNAs hydrolase)